MTTPDQPREFTLKERLAAQLVALDELGDREIAGRVGIGVSTLTRWKRDPGFREIVNDEVRQIADAVRRSGIGSPELRARALHDRWLRMLQIMRERAGDPQFKDVPGGTTGLLVHDVKVVGAGEGAERVDLYRLDTGLLAELRAHEQQAAQELGQWTEKRELTGKDGGPLQVSGTMDYSKLPPDKLLQLRQILMEAAVQQNKQRIAEATGAAPEPTPEAGNA